MSELTKEKPVVTLYTIADLTAWELGLLSELVDSISVPDDDELEDASEAHKQLARAALQLQRDLDAGSHIPEGYLRRPEVIRHVTTVWEEEDE